MEKFAKFGVSNLAIYFGNLLKDGKLGGVVPGYNDENN